MFSLSAQSLHREEGKFSLILAGFPRYGHTGYVVRTCRCYLHSGRPQPRYPGQMHPEEPCGQAGWGIWGSAPRGRSPQLSARSWHWSYHPRGCQAELRRTLFGAGQPRSEQRLQSPVQHGALASRGGLSPSTGGKCRVWHLPMLKYQP